ncbi:small acid-soluble spore protein P [Cohnella endophytica]|uniref:Small acid-soluble spore protein P n=1 Tax=Cohnella endophytica TaxID=2419778 RepID=A0A494X190_9BACL|nr:small acid-soluble spore protein P [Cohnella endophytica]RKP44488.1 small acid-soluble spore protein P [Cohnella endophytica]
MSKPKTEPVAQPAEHGSRHSKVDHQPVEPLSGSKKVKNRKHTRHNNAEG